MTRRDLQEREELLNYLIKRAKEKARNHRRVIFTNTGVLGLYGWYVVIPALLGLCLGQFLDKHYPVFFSWTFNLSVLCSVLGFIAATHWSLKEGYIKNNSARQKEKLTDEEISSSDTKAGL